MRNEKLEISNGMYYKSEEPVLSYFQYLDCSDELETRSFLFPHSSFVIPLQFFSDENDEDAPGKTEPPSEYKLRKLREEGQVIKSQELIGAIGLLFPALLLLFFAPYILRTCVEMLRFFFTRATELDPTKDGMVAGVFFRYFARMVWPILTVAFISAIISNVMQVGIFFTAKPITPNLSRIVPRIGQFFRRIFSIDGLFKFGMSLVKMVIIGGVAYFIISSELEQLLNLQKADLWTGFSFVASIAIRMLLIAAVLLLALALPDFMFQRWRFLERHKMTRQEIKEELKMHEADPQITNMIRSKFRELMRQNLAVNVPKADVVITNPTHLAIALQYDRFTMRGPKVVAKGADEIAARIRKIAQDNDVPLVENKALARDLFRFTNVGDMIPEVYFEIVAKIIIKVWKLKEDKRMREEIARMSA